MLSIPKNVVLVYSDARENTRVSTDGFVPLVAEVDSAGTPISWFFDTFLMTGLVTPSGRGFIHHGGELALREEWDWFIDRMLGNGEQIKWLNDAVVNTAKVLKTSNTADIHRVNVILAIPYPASSGSCDNRLNLVKWYVDETLKRVQSAGFTNINFIGYYWIAESWRKEADGLIIPEVAKYVESKGYGLFWVPYSGAVVDGWKSLGFRNAMLQPNFAFRDVGLERFDEIEALRQNHGLTIELELASYTRGQKMDWKHSFIEYCKAALRYGWNTKYPVGYYVGNTFVTYAKDKELFMYYRLITKLVNGTLRLTDLDNL
ncbi:MAG: DUF4855 domain-containing protein [Elusimicrobiota bacterium]